MAIESEKIVALLSCRWHPPSGHQEKWAHPCTEAQRCMHPVVVSTVRSLPAMFIGCHFVFTCQHPRIVVVVVVVVVVV